MRFTGFDFDQFEEDEIDRLAKESQEAAMKCTTTQACMFRLR